MVEPHPFNAVLWVPYLLLVLLALIVKPFPRRALLFLPIPPLTVYVLLSTTGEFLSDYLLGLSWLLVFWFSSDYILLTDVQRTLRQVPASKAPIENASLWRRTRWAISLLLSPRGVGWAHEPTTALPAHPAAGTSRVTFIAQRLWKTLLFFLVHDAANLHVQYNTMFRADGPGWRADGWAWRAVIVLSWALSTYSSMMMTSNILSIVGVASGLSRPEDWPAFFGAPHEAYTIRKMWGFVSTHGKYLAQDVLGLRSGSNASSYVQLFTAFALSASIHYGAETMALRSWDGGALVFFMLQPCMITVEDFLLFAARKAGMREGPMVRRLGYLWVWAWFTLTLPIWEEPLVRAGQMEEGIQFSILMGLWRGEWVLKQPFQI
ncbi:MBOAT-2 domain-containing protein [Mycena sanguinolenta]|uniref:MBOAT-2 domain-containing protein n=1 Tax=Mycena sanguinolenta TaxID=230812 RepID=A0A8H6XJR1_9AGAR|nr:MBOAT-2 domain-containing protein [Mycena sanguinolenta]